MKLDHLAKKVLVTIVMHGRILGVLLLHSQHELLGASLILSTAKPTIDMTSTMHDYTQPIFLPRSNEAEIDCVFELNWHAPICADIDDESIDKHSDGE